jgi:hypothetical protein
MWRTGFGWLRMGSGADFCGHGFHKESRLLFDTRPSVQLSLATLTTVGTWPGGS